MTTIINQDQINNYNLFILDPLSTIIKLAIISFKPIGTKISICNNLIGIQEPGLFQPIVRFVFKNNKTDLHYIYNPIEFACKKYLSETFTSKMPNIVKLFECGLKGLLNLCETYKNSPTSIICLNYYSTLILNYLNKPFNKTLFKPDIMTKFYTADLIDKVIKKWTDVKLQAVLDLNQYLLTNDNSTDNLNCLEIFMMDFDLQMQKLLTTSTC
jgi:hypothetical protein